MTLRIFDINFGQSLLSVVFHLTIYIYFILIFYILFQVKLFKILILNTLLYIKYHNGNERDWNFFIIKSNKFSLSCFLIRENIDSHLCLQNILNYSKYILILTAKDYSIIMNFTMSWYHVPYNVIKCFSKITILISSICNSIFFWSASCCPCH